MLLLLLANGTRFCILFIIDIVLNIYLILKLRQFFKKKGEITNKSLTGTSSKKQRNVKLSMSEVKNTMTTIFLSLLSILQHLVTFMVFIMLLISTDNKLIWNLTFISGFTTQVKHAANLFLFGVLNNKFRDGFKKSISNEPLLVRKTANSGRKHIN